jgi:hypothetical protein
VCGTALVGYVGRHRCICCRDYGSCGFLLMRVIVDMTVSHPYYVGTLEELDELLDMLQDDPDMFLYDTPRREFTWKWRIDET